MCWCSHSTYMLFIINIIDTSKFACILCGFNNMRRYLQTVYTVVPALGDPRRERPPVMYGHIINVPTHVNVKVPAISGHLPNADTHLLVVSTWYNGQCQQMPRFPWTL